MINDVQDKLRPIPAARTIRRELLRNSLAELQRVSGEFRAQRRVDRNTAKALIDLAALFNELGDDEGLDATRYAETNYREAVDIYRRLCESQPNDRELGQEYANALGELGNFLLTANKVVHAKQILVRCAGTGARTHHRSSR